MHHIVAAILVLMIVWAIAAVLRWKMSPVDVKKPDKVFRQDECYLCLDTMNCEVQTSCGHVFCGECLMEIIDSNPQTDCPVCRNPISIIYPDFNEKDAPRELVLKIAKFNMAKVGTRTFWQAVFEVPVIMLRIVKNFQLPNVILFWKAMALLLVGMCYLLLPFDIIDEEKYGWIGITDDIAFVLFCIFASSVTYYNRVNQQAAELLNR